MRTWIGCMIMSAMLGTMCPKEAQAASGQAVIPHFISDSSGFYTYLYFSNITHEDVDVEVALYNEDGTLLTEGNGATSGYVRAYPSTIPYYVEPSTGATVTFRIPAHKTFQLRLGPQYFNIGHGFVTWTQDSAETKALVMQGRVYRGQSSREFSYAIVINGGQPF